ncbi:histone H3-like protein [Lausannevirus]|uniref:Histone H3-like protein n=2 Tax=Lausannevirus TaxID=999883 RepID=A0A0N7G2G3_9VIRU|nr:histone H3-like protein [Lausannevirus]AEA07237.1 histone H3-like protein [Lausannevirus]ALH07048.1 histone H3-like protein [Port-miou virus]
MSKSGKKTLAPAPGYLASFVRSKETQLPRATTQHLLRKAGSRTSTADTFEPITGFVHMKLEKLLGKALLAMQFAKRTTLLKEDVKKAAEMMHLPVFAVPSKKESGAKGSVFLSCRQSGSGSELKGKETNMQEIRKQQRQTCMIIPKARFRDIAKEIVDRELEGVRLSEKALDLLQLIVESLTVRLLEKAVALTLEAQKDRVTGRSIEAIFKIEHGPL